VSIEIAYRPNLRRFAATAVVLGAVALAPSTAAAAGGTALGWGYDASGQVGSGSPSSSPCSCFALPTPVLGVSEATELAGGYEFGLALLAGGRVMSWGYNYDGELGDGSTTLNAVPTVVPSVSNVVAVAAGSSHALALLADGSILAWGGNSFGQLGLGSAEGPEKCQADPCSKVPVRVPGISDAIAISGGEYQSMALLANGTVVGWGDERHGEQGSGTGLTTGCQCTPSPTPIPGVSGAVAITAGGNTGGALLADGTVRNWGHNYEGQLGTGAPSPKGGCACLGPVSPAGLSGVRQLSAGGGQSLALLQNGTVVGWGGDFYGQAGDGKEAEGPCYCLPSPTPVIAQFLGAQAVDAGEEHSVVLLSDGSIRAWGLNHEGEVGNGEILNAILIPTPIGGVAGASGILASEYNSYALIGPSQALRVELAGDGAGTVGGSGILCPSACTQRYPQAQVESLRADPGAGFAGFSGPCSGTGFCRVRMDGDATVTATFGRPKGTAITKAKIVGRKKLATFSFSAPGAITGYECMLVARTRPKGAAKSAKRRKPRFSGCSSPRRYRHLKPGRYVFQVRALDILGADANPAMKKFNLKKPRKKKR
jgi:alpha-tubulin suppressor-like RCC1 family protein